MEDKNLLIQLIMMAAIPAVIQRAKEWRSMPWLAEHTDQVNRICSIAGAVAVAAGVAIVKTGSWDQGWDIHIVTPAGGVMAEGVIRAVMQFFGQEGWYLRLTKPAAVTRQLRASTGTGGGD